MDTITGLLSGARFVSAIARLCLGPLMPILAETLHFPEASRPALLSSYSSGYILTQIGGGYLADRFSSKLMIASTMGISALLTCYIGTVATSVTAWTRAFFCLGVVAGPLFPAGSSAIAAHVPTKKRAASAAIVDAAASAGTTVAAMSPLIASQIFGGRWQIVFQSSTVGLLAVALAVWAYFPTTVQQHGGDDNSHIGKNTPTTTPTTATTLSVLYRPLHLLTFVCHSVDNFTKYTINSWTATMLVNRHAAPLAWVGTILGMQEATGVASKVLVGIYGAQLMTSVGFQQQQQQQPPKDEKEQQQSTSSSPLLQQGIASGAGFFLQAICLFAAFSAPTIHGAGAWLLASAAAAGSHSIGYRSVYVQSVAPEYAGAVSGLGNTIASMASVVGPLVIGSAVVMAESPAAKEKGNGANPWTSVALWMLLVNLGGAMASMGIVLLPQNEIKHDGVLRKSV